MAASEMYKVHHNLGNLNYRKSDYTKAIDCYKKALDIYQEDYKVYYDLACAHTKLKDYELAIINYKEALKLKVNDLYTMNGLAMCYITTDNLDLAEELAQKVLQADKRLGNKLLEQIENQKNS